MTEALIPLKHVAVLNPEALDENTDPDYTFHYVDISNTGRGQLHEKPHFMTFGSSPSRARRVLRPGDTILSTVRTYLRAAWTVRDAPDHLVASTGFVCLRPRANVDPRFLGWVAQSDTVIEEIVARSAGVSYPAINPSEVGRIKVPIPPPSRQGAIADYLDRETARVDALIAAKQQMVELLEERLEDLREKAFNSLDAPFVKLGRFIRSIGQGVSPQAEARSIEGDEWGVLKLSAVKKGRFIPSEHKALPTDFTPDPELLPRSGDLLVTRANTPELVGDVCAVTTPTPRLLLCDLIYRVRLSQRLDPEYAAQALLTRRARRQLSSSARGSSQSMVKLRGEDIKNTSLPIPSLDSQRSMVNKLTAASIRLSAVTSGLKRSISLLREHRQALVTAAVTGQLDIPEAA